MDERAVSRKKTGDGGRKTWLSLQVGKNMSTSTELRNCMISTWEYTGNIQGYIHGLVLLEAKISRRKWVKMRLREEEQETNSEA